MTKSTKAQTQTAADVIEAVESEANPKPATPAKKSPKPRKNAKVQAQEPTKEEPKEEPQEPTKTLFHGFEVDDSADIAALDAVAKEATEAVEAINRKDADLLSAYMTLGKFASAVSPMFKSTKVYGLYLKQEMPACAEMDAALRSNCKWLYEALNKPEHEAYGKLLTDLGVNQIEDFKSANPTVIKREWKLVEKERKALEDAAKAGIEAEDAKEAEKALKDVVKAKQKEAAEAAYKEFEALIVDMVATLASKRSKQEIADIAGAMMLTAYGNGGGLSAIEEAASLVAAGAVKAK